MITSTGLGSGLDIKGLVDSLVAAERAGSDLQLNRKSSRLAAKFSALGSLKGALSSFESSLSGLNTLANYTKVRANSSDKTALSVSAGSDAIANTYSVQVSRLAESHSLASPAFTDSDSTAIGTGELTIRFGTTDYDSETDAYNGFTLNPDSNIATLTIDSSNNTLEGVMAAINEADVGVRASIVNDGSGYRLLLTADATGSDNSLEISVDDGDGNDTDTTGLSALAFNAGATVMTQTAAALDAEMTINGLAVSSSDNTVTSAIPGVTLNLSAVTASPVTVTIEPDLEATTKAVNTFIAGYNQFVSVARSLSSYDVKTDTPAALTGDFTLRSISSQVDAILRSAVPGVTGSVASLAEVGITTNANGALVLDNTRFQEVLAQAPEDVIQLFAAYAVPEDADISYNGATSATVVGDYAVEVTTPAAFGYYEGASVLPDFGAGGTLEIDADNDSLTLEIDGIDIGEISLTAGVYDSGDSLAAELQARINGSDAMRDAGKTVTVAYDGSSDSFSIMSSVLGNTSAVNVLAVDTNSAAELGFSVGSGTGGVDVAGTIGGVAATGAGNVLTAAAGTDAEGLSLVISGATTGSRGSVNFTRGVASQFEQLLSQLLEEEGALNDRLESYEDRIEDVSERREELELRWEKVRQRYLDQFNALDLLLGQMQSTSTYLEGQLSNLVKPNSIGGNN